MSLLCALGSVTLTLAFAGCALSLRLSIALRGRFLGRAAESPLSTRL